MFCSIFEIDSLEKRTLPLRLLTPFLINISDMDDTFVRQTASDFLDYISYSNGKVLDLHNERNGSGISDADAAFVKDIIDNDFVEVPF